MEHHFFLRNSLSIAFLAAGLTALSATAVLAGTTSIAGKETVAVSLKKGDQAKISCPSDISTCSARITDSGHHFDGMIYEGGVSLSTKAYGYMSTVLTNGTALLLVEEADGVNIYAEYTNGGRAGPQKTGLFLNDSTQLIIEGMADASKVTITRKPADATSATTASTSTGITSTAPTTTPASTVPSTNSTQTTTPSSTVSSPPTTPTQLDGQHFEVKMNSSSIKVGELVTASLVVGPTEVPGSRLSMSSIFCGATDSDGTTWWFSESGLVSATTKPSAFVQHLRAGDQVDTEIFSVRATKSMLGNWVVSCYITPDDVNVNFSAFDVVDKSRTQFSVVNAF